MARDIIVDLYEDGKMVGRMCVDRETADKAIADGWVEWGPYPEG